MVGAGVVPAILFKLERDRERKKEMSLQIGKYVMYALGEENAPELDRAIGGRVSPVVQPEDGGTVLPYVWYYSAGMQEESTKDGHSGDVCQVEVEVVARNYREMIRLLQLVRQAMERAWETWEGEPTIMEQSFSAGPEEYDDSIQAYCRKMTYNIETHD